MKYGFIKVTTASGKYRLRCFTSTSVRFAVTESWSYPQTRAVTHVATGMLAADCLNARGAHYLASIFDRLFTSETVAGMQAEFKALPPVMRAWVIGAQKAEATK